MSGDLRGSGDVAGVAGARAGLLTRTQVAARAAYVLRGNDRGGLTVAAPWLYPHMWSWDAAFVAIGLARLSASRALTELETLFAAQWRTGMVPHIVFSPGAPLYEPGPDRWACREACPDAPPDPATSGILQPPVHAVAVRRILDAVRIADAAERRDVVGRIRALWPALLAWHRYLVAHRDPERRGLLTLYHGWESGMDNSPRWDGPYADVVPSPQFTPFRRSDVHALAGAAAGGTAAGTAAGTAGGTGRGGAAKAGVVSGGAAQRPTDADYKRYQWLVEELRQAGYDDARIQSTLSFQVADVFASAIFAAANEELAMVGDELGLEGVDELLGHAARFRRGVIGTTDERGFAADLNLRRGTFLRTDTIAGFAPLLCGGLEPARQRRLMELLASPAWCGHPGLACAVPPSTSPAAPDFDPVRYWRGPQWPPMNWLLIWGLERCGEPDAAHRMREATLEQLSDGVFAEYYHPFTGEPFGGRPQSWSAAVALDLLAR
ncbi:amylo-alpha-1,6-glucosidase [Actinomadura sp. HBU206391]|uniref:amylo-alpha-1,6-glucosidase n=1 Tax=Actinomadura sp. HBU206391 TaxID=2731692 RepID=UPI001DBBBCC5|nr:glycogen debranching protein [Actinomadura sp. HBU206391]MBC6460391.1 glycogen debranching protein [Actinomadura sp. HBU206391]